SSPRRPGWWSTRPKRRGCGPSLSSTALGGAVPEPVVVGFGKETIRQPARQDSRHQPLGGAELRANGQCPALWRGGKLRPIGFAGKYGSGGRRQASRGAEIEPQHFLGQEGRVAGAESSKPRLGLRSGQ